MLNPSRPSHCKPSGVFSRVADGLPALALPLLASLMLMAVPLPAQAQTFNLGNILRQALSPAAGQCRKLLAWVRTPMAGTADSAPTGQRSRRVGGSNLDSRTAYLLSDEVFVKHFDKRYEQLTVQDFRSFQQETARTCMQGGEFTPVEWQTVLALWNERQHASTVQALQAQRAQQVQTERAALAAKNELEELGAELRQANAQNISLSRLQAIRQKGRSLGSLAGADANQTFESTFQRSAETVAPDLLRQRVAAVMALAQSPEQLSELSTTRESVSAQGSGLGVGLPSGDPALQQLLRRESELTTAAANVERNTLAGFADGLPGLAAGVLWQREFQARWGSFPGGMPSELKGVQTEFRERREAVLAKTGPQLVRSVQQATTVAQAQASVGTYTLPTEAGLAPVQGMRAAVEDRIRLIERNDALGRATGAGPALAETPAQAAATATPPRMADRSAGAGRASGTSGEPSEEVMFDLVRQKFENAANRVKGLYGQCEGGGNTGNPVNALMCLGMNMQRGATGGALAMPTRITKFSKIGCEKSPSRPGYNCEYEIQTDSPVNQQFSKMTGFEVDQAGFGQGRFVRNRESRWLMITGD